MAAIASFLLLGACSSDIDDNRPVDATAGVATYDAIRQASADCQARGGNFELRRNGDPTVTSDYACRPVARTQEPAK